LISLSTVEDMLSSTLLVLLVLFLGSPGHALLYWDGGAAIELRRRTRRKLLCCRESLGIRRDDGETGVPRSNRRKKELPCPIKSIHREKS
jgi:hypothetical protein